MSDSNLSPLPQQGQPAIMQSFADSEKHCEQVRRAQKFQNIWNDLRSQFSPVNDVLTIPGLVFAGLYQPEVQDLLLHYELYVNCQGMLVRDAAVHRVFLGPREFIQKLPLLHVAGQLSILMPSSPDASSPTSTPPSTPSPQADEGNVASPSAKLAKIPRPPNAFIIYRKAHHADIVAQNPGLHNNEISVIIGRMWNKESDAVRADFKTQAENLKLEHLRAYPDYQYKPRKPSEKKKRMSKKKAAAAAALLDQADTATRAKSMHIVNQYSAIHEPVEQLTSKVNGGRQLTLPLPSGLSVEVVHDALQHNPLSPTNFHPPKLIPSDPMKVCKANVFPGGFVYGFTPSSSYQNAQADDMAFFPDERDPAFQALAKEVGEAYEAGYYDDFLIPSETPNGLNWV